MIIEKPVFYMHDPAIIVNESAVCANCPYFDQDAVCCNFNPISVDKQGVEFIDWCGRHPYRVTYAAPAPDSDIDDSPEHPHMGDC